MVPEKVPPKILYENGRLLVINKPAPLAMEELSKWLKRYLGTTFFWLVHRLDKETTGVLLIAKEKTLAEYLKRLFRRRLVKKEYLARVRGRLSPREGEINIPLKRKARFHKTLPSVAPGTRWAKSRYRVEKYDQDGSLLRVSPTTGRTHQIRVHLSLIGHPIKGDERYGGGKNEHLMLHAWRLSFKDEKGRYLFFEAPVPHYLR